MPPHSASSPTEFTADRRIAPAVFADHARESVRLGVWYVRRLLERGDIDARGVPRALSDRVNLYRRTTLFDGRSDVALGHEDPQWARLSAELADLVRTRGGGELESAALAVLEPWLATASREPRPPQWFGCWSGVVVGPGIADRDGLWGKVTNPRKIVGRLRRTVGLSPSPLRDLELHFANACLPESPFRAPQALAAGLRALLLQTAAEHPDVDRVWCNSWLNNRPEFTALFPAGWRESARLRVPGAGPRWVRTRWNTDNWWGQFTDRSGGFHRELGRRFREADGVFPYPCLLCDVPLDALLRHLESCDA